MNIWFASGNLHKKGELTAILNSGSLADKGGFTLLLPRDAGLDFDPAETETGFHGNALLKARELYSLLEKSRPSMYRPGDPIIADDSGICVDALGGRPGIYSARYAGASAPAGVAETVSGGRLRAHERNALLLEELGDAAPRTARFVCAMVLFYSPDRFFIAQETCEGEIVKNIDTAKGSGGFGYDPVFYLPDRGKTMAEISDEEKNIISHRGKAGKTIAAFLKTELHC
jgi:XTP/dITP diphosphohydrolase